MPLIPSADCSTSPSVAQCFARWARPMPDMGAGVYQLTLEPGEYRHAYHVICPWSADGRWMVSLRHDRQNPTATVCVHDMQTGAMREVATTDAWSSHNGAYQQWQGDKHHIIYQQGSETRLTITGVDIHGQQQWSHTTEHLYTTECSPDGQALYGATPMEICFPQDQIAQRHDKGLHRLDIATGRCDLILSIADALALLPARQRKQAEGYHLYMKMMIHHPRQSRILLNLTNTLWDRAGGEAPVRALITVGSDGSDPAYLGACLHHPNWHSLVDQVICNVKDFNDEVRFGLYPGRGGQMLQYVPQATGSGHPTFSRDGQLILTDRSWSDNGLSGITVCDPQRGDEKILARYKAYSEGYTAFKAVDQRTAGVSVMDAIKAAKVASNTWQTHAHPAWSDDGSAVLFNADLGKGSQLFALDFAAAMANVGA